MTRRSVEANPQADEIQKAADLLGGPKVLRRQVSNTMQVHEIISSGLPRAALTSLVQGILRIPRGKVVECAGISLRTYQRFKPRQHALLSVEQSARTWQFAEILAKATKVLGSQNDAEQWMERPAVGLNDKRPIDLITTPAGVRVVEEYLDRMEFGVYA